MTASTNVDQILIKVRELTARPHRIRGATTEVFYDTRLYGEDFFDLIEWIIDEYGTDFSGMDASQYAPGEGGGMMQLPLLFGFRPYKSLTVGKLAEAVELGRWR